jgi:hypothetical protein
MRLAISTAARLLASGCWCIEISISRIVSTWTSHPRPFVLFARFSRPRLRRPASHPNAHNCAVLADVFAITFYGGGGLPLRVVIAALTDFMVDLERFGRTCENVLKITSTHTKEYLIREFGRTGCAPRQTARLARCRKQCVFSSIAAGLVCRRDIAGCAARQLYILGRRLALPQAGLRLRPERPRGDRSLGRGPGGCSVCCLSVCLINGVGPVPEGWQQPGDQPTTRRTELRHGTSCGIFSAVCLGLLLPSIFRRRRSFFFGLPGRRAAAQGGAQGGEHPRPSGFCAAAGRERVSGPTRRPVTS